MGRRASIVLALLAAGALSSPGLASAAIITPNTTVDQFNTDAANCSLREAVDAADDNSNAEAPGCTAGNAAMDTIQLAPGTYELTIPQNDALSEDVASGDLFNSSALRVEALPGATDPVTIDANMTDRLFQSFANLTIDGITLTGGFVDNPNAGSAVTGGAIANSSGVVLTMTDSALVGNRADGGGGALAPNGPTSLTNVTISDNESTEQGGGGVRIGGMGNTLTLDHVTITDNDAVTNGTASGGEFGGGVAAVNGATATVHNSIIAANTENTSSDDEPNCSGPVNSTGGNVIGTIGDCTFAQDPDPGDDEINVADPGLGAIADNGGTSLTHNLLAGSPAIAQGVPACQATDQRGILRGVAVCDAGAFEEDSDDDTVGDNADNCPLDVNTNQANNDGDGQGDICDPDDDNDTVADPGDNCPTNANADQANSDADPQGNACDADDDDDTLADNADNCPTVVNLGQANNDSDAQGDPCDADDDNDGVLDLSDGCPTVAGVAANVGCPSTATSTAQAPPVAANPDCAALRAKLKQAKSKKKKQKIRKQLRKLGC